MNCDERNRLFSTGPLDRDDLWPKITEYEARHFRFRWEFGLESLPEAPGVITIRGPRQSGKSTWLEMSLRQTLEDFGLGSAYFLNGDDIYSHPEFEEKLVDLENGFAKKTKVKRLFIDEITQIRDWERVIKRLIDRGRLRDVLVVTTGSNAADLLHGTERLPGRKGKLDRSEYLFLPISFKEFWYKVGSEIGTSEGDILWAYVLSGGSPLAIEDLYRTESISETFTSLISDWILGDIAQSGRNRIFLLNVLRKIYAVAPNSVSYTKLAQDAGLANNSAALDYVERLADLLCVLPMMAWDAERNTSLARKPTKIPFINMGAAWVFHPQAPRYLHEIKKLEGQQRGAMFEWVVAQELWRRQQLNLQRKKSKASAHLYSTDLMYWASKDHEIDFVLPDGHFFEVKSGKTTPHEFAWFPKTFPKKRLTIISESTFETNHLQSINLKDFLLQAESDLYYDSDKVPWNSN